MNRIFVLLICLFCLHACKPGIPEDIIKPEQMQKILYDIHTVDGYLGTLPKPDSAKIIAAAYYKGIYKKFNIDSASYTKSLHYYYGRPDLLNPIYEKLMKDFDVARKQNDKRLSDEALELQKKELAKNAKVLVVPDSTAGPRKFTMGTNPFTLWPTPVE